MSATLDGVCDDAEVNLALLRPLGYFRAASIARVALTVLAIVAASAQADESAIRKSLAERLPSFPKIDEISPTPIAGLYEVRIGTDVWYSDEQGDHLFLGSIIDTRTRTDLTQARIDKLTAIEFTTLPLKDAMLIKQGSGARRLVVFADPDDAYSKRLERDLSTLKDVSIYTFLLPIHGPESTVRAKDIWCSKESSKVWRAWMVDGQLPPKTGPRCDSSALDRNLELARRYKVQGTPAVVFEDGTRAPGAIPAAQIEQRLAAATKRD